MQTKRIVTTLLLVLYALTAACGGGDDTGNSENDNRDSRDHRDPAVGLDDLIDGASAGDGDGDGDAVGDGGSTSPHDDGGTPHELMDGQTPMDDGSVTPDPDAEVVPIDVPPVSEDPGVRGPWPVGVRTVNLEIGGGMSPVEIWYPAVLGSEAGKSQVVYDFIQWLPPEGIEGVPATERPVPVYCDCYRDLPIDSAHGSFPVVEFVHNFGVFRTSSVSLMEQWASRGFIVIALDHPRTTLRDVLAYTSLGSCTGSGLTDDTMRTRDVAAVLAMVRAPSGGFSFLSGVADTANMAVAGHADGAEFAAKSSGQAGVRLIMLWNNPIAVTKKGDLEAVAYFAGAADRTVGTGYTSIKNAYLAAPKPAVFIGADGAGSQSMTELCNAKNSLGRDGMDISQRYGLCDLDYTILRAAWDCSSTYIDQSTADAAFGHSTTAVLEQFLKGKDRSAAYTKFAAEWGEATVRQ